MNNISTQARLILMDNFQLKIHGIINLIFLTFLILILSNVNSMAQATVGERINMGLYGGAADDLTYSPTGRLFAGIQTPGSIFSTDDSCKTWKRVFQTDSLEFAGGQRGWGGGGRQIFCNDSGWVLALTQQHGGNLSAIVLSQTFGDSGTFFTLMDHFILPSVVSSATAPSSATAAILNDYGVVMAMRNYLISYDGSTYSLELDAATVSGLPSSTSILDIAIPNMADYLPLYFIATNSFDGHSGWLYKLDTSGATKISLPSSTQKAQRVFTHPKQITSDTLVISVLDTVTNQRKAYRSFDGGTTWADITPSVMNQFPLSDVDYSPDWVSSMPLSNGLRIILPGAAYSDDLGITWNTYSLVNNSNATHPENPLFIVGSRGRGPVISQNGNVGPWIHQVNYGLAAVKAAQIASSKGVYYLATNAGLAYTTAYFDPTVAYEDRWLLPHGDFPLPNVGDDAGITAVAVNPNDSLHVIAGYSWGFSVSTSGPYGFSYVNPVGWNSMAQYDQGVTDIKFINSDTIIATTGSKFGVQQMPVTTGNIWRSVDGGMSWSKITPMGLEQPNCVAYSTAFGSTVIYVGTGHFQHGVTPIAGSLWRSDDFGNTWTKVNFGPNSVSGPETDMPIYDIIVEKNSLDTIYIAAGQNLGHAMVISYNGGVTYNYTTVTGEGEFSSLMKYSPNLIFVANRREIWGYNLSSGVSGLINRGMPGEFVPDLERGSLLAATSTGLYRIDLKDTLSMTIQKPNFAENNDMTIMPNPFYNQLTISFISSTTHEIHLQVFDLAGRLVISHIIPQNTKNFSFDTNKLTRGLYVMKTDDGQKSRAFKLVKN